LFSGTLLGLGTLLEEELHLLTTAVIIPADGDNKTISRGENVRHYPDWVNSFF
jgi:hypothetical protein